VRLDAPDLVALFAYDNGAFVAESYRNTAAAVKIVIPGENARVRDLLSGKLLAADGPVRAPGASRAPQTVFSQTLEPHSYRVYRAEH
jgi:hypothetical protein